MPYFKQLSAQNESESDLLRDFEVGLGIFANPSDKLHLNMLLKRWKINAENIIIDSTNDLEIVLSTINKYVVDKDHKAVLSALILMNRDKDNLDFVKAIDYLDEYSKSKINQEECALISEDIIFGENIGIHSYVPNMVATTVFQLS